MKRNARLYLPWPTVSDYLAVKIKAADVQPRRRKPSASVEMLEGGCLLFRLLRAPPVSPPAAG
jgi:hypothetical protein